MIHSRLIGSVVLCFSLVHMEVVLPLFAADPWADHVVQYVVGTGVPNEFIDGSPFNNADTSLGAPTRYTSDPNDFGGAVTPFQSPFRSSEVVTIGEGGMLLLQFDEPVENDPQNPFGIDLLLFGNAFYFDDDFPSGVAGASGTEAGVVEVSANGVNFFTVPSIIPDGIYPTLGYTDLTDPFQPSAGTVPTDFTRPVDPSFDPTGKSFSAIVAGYGGSGGGVGIDLSVTGLSQISYVRISNPIGSGVTPEIDAMSDVSPVPEPSIWLLVIGAMMITGLLRPRHG